MSFKSKTVEEFRRDHTLELAEKLLVSAMPKAHDWYLDESQVKDMVTICLVVAREFIKETGDITWEEIEQKTTRQGT